MANKFTQSVLQRLEQEQKVQQKTKPQTKTVTKKTEDIKTSKPVKKDKPEIVATDIEIIKTETLPEPAHEPIVENQILDKAFPDIPDISDYLRLEPARSAKNKTFYLDVEVIDALCAAARRQHVTDSKLCNDILRRVLGVGGIH